MLQTTSVDAFVPKGALWHSEGISVRESIRPQKVGVQLLHPGVLVMRISGIMSRCLSCSG